MHILAAAAGLSGACGTRGIQRIQHCQGEAHIGEMGGDPADVLHSNILDGRDVAAREIQIARLVPVRCEVRRAAGGGGETAELAGGDLAFRLGEILIQHLGVQGGDFQQNGLDEGVAFRGFGIRGDAENTFTAGVGP